MAEETKVKTEVAEPKEVSGKTRYFKSRVASYGFLKKDGTEVKFTAYLDVYKGDPIRIGYLATDDPEVIKLVEANPKCVSVKQAEYDEAVKDLKLAPMPPS